MSQRLDAIMKSSFLTVSRSIYEGEGMRGFFRGLGPTYLRAFPVNASAIFVYERMMRMIGAEKVCNFSHRIVLYFNDEYVDSTVDRRRSITRDGNYQKVKLKGLAKCHQNP